MTTMQLFLAVSVPIAANMAMFIYLSGRIDHLTQALTEGLADVKANLAALSERLAKLETAMDWMKEYRGFR